MPIGWQAPSLPGGGGGGGGGTADKLTTADQDKTASVTVADEDLAMATAITQTPANDSNIDVYVNGVQVSLGDLAKNRDCYFSGDGGVTPRAIENVVAGDFLYWMGSIAGYQLSAADKISLAYLV